MKFVRTRNMRAIRILTSAQMAALYIFRMVPNLIMYILPNNTLMRADIRESIAVVLAIGSVAAASIWSIVMMALKRTFRTVR